MKPPPSIRANWFSEPRCRGGSSDAVDPRPRKSPALRAALACLWLAVAGLALAACSSGHPSASAGGSQWTPAPSGGGCHDGLETCPCTTPGARAACGHVTRKDGDYLTCSVGESTCVDGAWGPCAGDHVVAQSLHSAALTPGGLSLDLLATTCTDPCDPYCSTFQAELTDVDAGSVVVRDGGVTLPSSTGTHGGGCRGLQCSVPVCAGTATTSLTGKVYDPAGKVPLYNVAVYVPVDSDLTHLPALASAWTAGVSCGACTGNGTPAVATTQSGSDGSFTLTGLPTGTNIPLVVETGKWRRTILLSNLTACGANTVANNCTATDKTLCTARLPANRYDGYNPANGGYASATSGSASMPQIAMVTGSADPFECMLLKAGLDPAEFGSSTRNFDRHIHLFTSPDAPGTWLDSAHGDAITGDALWNSATLLGKYDATIFACEGAAIDKKTGVAPPPAGVSPYKNVIDYATAGGRVLTSHYGYVWLQYPFLKDADTRWKSVASWQHSTGSTDTQSPLLATIDTTFTKGSAFADWLLAVGASTTRTALSVNEGRQDLTTVGASSRSWMTATDTNLSPASTYSPHFTFNTPYGAAGASCGRVNFSDFHVSAQALVSGNTDQCLSDTDCGFTSTCQGATDTLGSCSESCTATSDCHDPSYACGGATAGTCQPIACTTSCSHGTCKTGSCDCTSNTQCGSGRCNLFAGKTYGSCAAKSCFAGSDCGNSEQCVGATLGQCSKGCAASSDCGGGELCVSGRCTGCRTTADCSDNTYATSCTGAVTAYGACSGNTGPRCSAFGVSGRGTAASVSALGILNPTLGDTGALPWWGGHNTASLLSLSAGTLLRAGVAQADTLGDATGTNTSASIATVNLSVAGIGITADIITSHASAACTASAPALSGSSLVARLVVAGVSITVTGAPNQTVPLLVGRLVINEQIQSVSGASGTITVNALHLSVLGVADVILSGSTAGANCSCLGAVNDTTHFPVACAQGPLTPQERALEFMFFDLTSCVSADIGTPPVPVTTYSAATFTQDYTASCPPGTHVRWREVDWQATIPPTASVGFSAQSGKNAATLLPALPLPIATTTTSTTLPQFDAAYIDTGPTGTGPFGRATPPVASEALLRMTFQLNPTADLLKAPALNAWHVQYDCLPSE